VPSSASYATRTGSVPRDRGCNMCVFAAVQTARQAGVKLSLAAKNVRSRRKMHLRCRAAEREEKIKAPRMENGVLTNWLD